MCRLRREIARRIDSLANGVEEGTPPGIASGGGSKREGREISELGAEHSRVAPRFEQGDAKSKNKGRPGRPLSLDGGDTPLSAGGEYRAHSGALVKRWAHRGSTLGPYSVHQGVARSDTGKTSLTRRVNRAEEANNASLQDELGSPFFDDSSCSSSSSSSSSGGGGGGEPAHGLDGMRRVPAKLDDSKSTREAARRTSERGRLAVEFPPVMPQRVDDKQTGSSDRSSHRPDEGKPRAREVRFLLEEEPEETNTNVVAIGGAVDGAPQTAQRKGERDILDAAVNHEAETDTKNVEDGGCWTCVVCRTQNDEVGGAEGCPTCGRRRRRRPPPRCRGGPSLGNVPADHPTTGISRKLGVTTDRLHERERGGKMQGAKDPCTDDDAKSNVGSRWKKAADIAATRNTAAQSERRGPYDVSSFAKMREATQPIVNARLGLTREIQSLLSSIRR